ncbi:large ribosomal subunit protein uL18m [Aulostomus maculatus]
MALNGSSRSVRLLFGQIQRCPLGPTNHTVFQLPVRCVTQAAPKLEPRAEDEKAVNPIFENRNPRNLEQLALAVKDRGWKTTWPPQDFHHMLMLTRTQRNATAEVFSCSSPGPVLSCSTKEWALKRQLHSTYCVVACQALGEVLAHRCKQAGITRMVLMSIPWTFRSDAVQAFRKAMKEGGIILNEPRRKYVGT